MSGTKKVSIRVVFNDYAMDIDIPEDLDEESYITDIVRDGVYDGYVDFRWEYME